MLQAGPTFSTTTEGEAMKLTLEARQANILVHALETAAASYKSLARTVQAASHDPAVVSRLREQFERQERDARELALLIEGADYYDADLTKQAAVDAADEATYGAGQEYLEPCCHGHYHCAQRAGGECHDELWHRVYAAAGGSGS